MGPEQGSSLQTASAVNASRTGDAGLGVSERARLVLEILMVLMCLGAVTGNILVIVIVAATKSFHSVTSVLIMNLAISDLLVGVGVMPFVAISIMNRGWVDFSGLCLYVGYTSSVYCTASVLTLAVIALDRYHSIMDCLRYSSRCTLWRTCAVVVWIWLQALLTSCPPLLGWSSISYVAPMYSCAVNRSNSPSYTAFMAALSYLIPAGIILFCYVNIVKVARSHARRIHSLEDSVQRSRNPDSTLSPGDSSHLRCPSRLIYHLSGEFVSEVRREQGNYTGSAPPDTTAEQNNSTSRRFFSFLAQTSQQHQNHHGVLRLLLVILAFFLCWTPFIGVALVQAAETAISGRSSLVPPSVVTFSYLLVLLNSDINPLLYALLSQRFQSALQGLRQKIIARLGISMASEGELRAEEEDGGRNSDPNTLTTAHLSPPSWSETSACEDYSSVFTVSTNFKHYSRENLCKLCHHDNIPPSSLKEQDATSGFKRVDCLQVPSRTQEGSRLPFSALTKERQATFFYGQITVRVEHVC
ncbi:5-hydroxytryptamine receptor 1D [Notolabrus celidotus]|uniref:5-hydroxytryptamine receptor 1D n=1 Tax=Notolabrus celidotus TaxID=1203425 RepID=UPI00148F8578|nr:5-hydroxytryptamine receptor 1D [Notolabrus celidotus]